MHPVLAMATAAAGLFVGLRMAARMRREIRASARRREDAKRTRADPRNKGELKLDPATGVYRTES